MPGMIKLDIIGKSFLLNIIMYFQNSLELMLKKLKLKIIKLEKHIEPSSKYTISCIAKK